MTTEINFDHGNDESRFTPENVEGCSDKELETLNDTLDAVLDFLVELPGEMRDTLSPEAIRGAIVWTWNRMPGLAEGQDPEEWDSELVRATHDLILEWACIRQVHTPSRFVQVPSGA